MIYINNMETYPVVDLDGLDTNIIQIAYKEKNPVVAINWTRIEYHENGPLIADYINNIEPTNENI